MLKLSSLHWLVPTNEAPNALQPTRGPMASTNMRKLLCYYCALCIPNQIYFMQTSSLQVGRRANQMACSSQDHMLSAPAETTVYCNLFALWICSPNHCCYLPAQPKDGFIVGVIPLSTDPLYNCSILVSRLTATPVVQHCQHVKCIMDNIFRSVRKPAFLNCEAAKQQGKHELI